MVLKTTGRHQSRSAVASAERLTWWTAVLGLLAAGLSVLAIALPLLLH